MMSEIDTAQSFTRSELEVIPDGEYLSNDRRDILQGIRDMKQGKIRAFQEATAAGAIDAEVCNGVTGALMTDVAICDTLINTDFGNEASVDHAMKIIKSVVSASPQPSHQEDYTRSLTDNEASMELFYAKVIEALQARMRCAA